LNPIGITTTVPIEVLLAAGYRAVDLNNLFVNDPNPQHLVDIAERSGFPQNCCTWIKGIYAACLERGIDTVICVTTGDCSNTIMLMEVLKLKGLRVIPFAYPSEPDVSRMQECLETLARTLGTSLSAAEAVRLELQPCRHLLQEMDDLTWKEGLVSGWENHLWLVSSSDFNGDPGLYRQELESFLARCRQRRPHSEKRRLAYIGVPSVFARDLYRFIEQQDARVVFNEVQRQFAMIQPCGSLAEQYSGYTYPYSIFDRVRDIRSQLPRREISAVIHYVQAFCHRAIGDIIFRGQIDLPVLTIEGNVDFLLTPHLRTKVEAFTDMLGRNQSTQRGR
jgi:benzoyl-CoA reductase/2-hydroxyglutaryl-CoA dehydratase subunit BcrC/BadD/HgdB